VEEALRRVALSAEAAIPACNGVAIAIAWQGKPTAALCTSDVVREVDSVQYQDGFGPCLDAMDQLQVFRVDFLPEGRSWPTFAEAAARRGMLSSMSVPLIAGGEVWGALNLYSGARDGFRGYEELGMELAAQAERALAAHGEQQVS